MILTTNLHNWTPTLYSDPLSMLSHQSVWLKMECFQPVGSYKIRGIGRLCQHMIRMGKKSLACSSGGNAGVAVAYAGRCLGVKVDVFLPSTSNQIYVDAIKAEGAKVHIAGDVWDEANEAAKLFAENHHAGFIPPFDHPLIWAGHATMITEVAEQGIVPDAVLVAVGGGGLACGVLEGMHQQGWFDIPVITIETEGAASFAKSVAADQLITLDKIDTIATSLGAKRVTEQLFKWRKLHPITPITVSDHCAIIAVEKFVESHRVYVEPSAGAVLSLIYEQHPALSDFRNLLVIICGGVGISPKLVVEMKKRAG